MLNFLKNNFNEDWIEQFNFLHTYRFQKLLKTFKDMCLDTVIYPKLGNVFRIFRTIKIDDIKVVLITKEPYKVKGQATGIPMAIENLNYITPLLQNIFDEIEREYGERPTDTSLKYLLDQGVLPLYTSFTCEELSNNNHALLWSKFIEELLGFLSNKGIVFVLLGKDTYGYMKYLDTLSDTIIIAPNPLGDSYKKGVFYGCGVFSKVDKKLKRNNNFKINWVKNE